MEQVTVPKAKHEEVKYIDDLITKAHDTEVHNNYIKDAEDLSFKMSGNIKAREILEMLLEYPEREYPVVEVVDPKKSKKQVKKEEPPKKKAVKKRKKKEPVFIYPEWASDLTAVISQVQNMESLIANSEELHLDQDFVKNVNNQLARFKKEIGFRTKVEEDERIALELKKAKKKTKKGKK